MTNKNFCPNSSQMWITRGGGRLNRNSKFVATNLSPKTLKICSKNSLKNIKHYIKNLIYFRHILNVSFGVYTGFDAKLLYSQYNLSKIPKYNTFIKVFCLDYKNKLIK